MILATYSLDQVQELTRREAVSPEELTDYLRAWNAGPHFTRAVWCDGSIRNFDPATGVHRHLWQKYGVQQ